MQDRNIADKIEKLGYTVQGGYGRGFWAGEHSFEYMIHKHHDDTSSESPIYTNDLNQFYRFIRRGQLKLKVNKLSP